MKSGATSSKAIHTRSNRHNSPGPSSSTPQSGAALLSPEITRKKESSEQSIERLAIGLDMKAGLGVFASWMIGVGTIIGSYAWLIHGPMIARAGPLPAITAWLIAGFMALPVAIILAELSSMFPYAGGPYVFKYFAFKRLIPKAGELIGFISGWLFYVCLIAGLACMANGLTNLLSTRFWGDSLASPIWFGPLVITVLFVSCTSLNMVSIGKAAKINNVVTVGKFFMAIAFGALVFLSPSASVDNALVCLSPSGSGDFWGNVSCVLLLALSGYAGIEMSACASSETVGARKNVPIAILLTLFSVMAFYVFLCIAVSAASPYVLSHDGTTVVVSGTNIQATCPQLAGLLGGSSWETAMTAAVVASIVGCGFSALLGLARVGYSMAATGLFPKVFATLHEGTHAPRYALLFQMWCLLILSIAANLATRTGAYPDAYVFMGEVFGVMYSFLALLYGFCLLALRYTNPEMERPFRVGRSGNSLAWVLTIVAALVYGYAAFACTNLLEQLVALLLLLSGIPIYLWFKSSPQ